jgi:hypothetical protein
MAAEQKTKIRTTTLEHRKYPGKWMPMILEITY